MIVKQSPDGILVTDQQGNCREANPKMCEILGYTREQLLGLNVAELIPRAGLAVVGPPSLNEIKRLDAQLQQAPEMETLATVVCGIAHEFNNILTTIMGTTELVLNDIPMGSLMHRRLDRVLKAGYRARDVIRQAVAFSQHKDERKPVQVSLIVKETFKLMQILLPETVEARQKIEAAGSIVMADPAQIRQVLMNLCTNACHAMRERGGALEVSLDDVDLDADFAAGHPGMKPGPYVRLRVSDTVHDIDLSFMQQIFDPFFPAKNTGDGTRLRLAVVHRIVKKHGGTITVHSEPGKGTTFTVFFPRTDSIVTPQAEAPGATLERRMIKYEGHKA